MYPTVAKQPATQPKSPQEAVDAMIARLSPVPMERIGLTQCGGRVLGEQVVMDRPSPAADVSAMDGYAVRYEDVTGGGALPLAGEARIGQAPPALEPGQAIHIVTGGPVPSGADTVIRREDLIEHGDRIEVSADSVQRISQGANIRYNGENAATGDVVASPGVANTPALAGALATVGCTSPLVHRRVRVAVLVTGDEVLPAEARVSPYQLRDSNGPALSALLGGPAWIELVAQRRAGDDRAALREAVEKLLATSDALVLTGGVSMGNRDFVPAVLEEVGAETVFHRVPQRPGMPALGAVGPDAQAVFGLPGNPVSVLVTARRIAVNVLRHLAGFTQPHVPATVTIDNSDDKHLGLWWHRLVRMTGPGRAAFVPGRGSGDIIAAGGSDGFVEMPPDATGIGPWPLYRWSIET